jgi:hypothetical protein
MSRNLKSSHDIIDAEAATVTDETLTIRVTVIGGQRCADDFIVIWRGLTIGRIMLASGTPSGRPQWTWSCCLGGRPTRGGESGTGTGFGDCKRQFREAWERIRATLTDQDIARARSYAENSAEALARYDRRKRGEE